MASWAAAFEAVPAQASSPSEGDDAIRGLKEEIRKRLAHEHTMYTTTGSSGEEAKDGIHRPGSARAYYQSTEPTTLPNGNALTSETEVTKGTLWIDSTDSDFVTLKAWAGSEFKTVQKAPVGRATLEGVLFTATDVMPPIIFPSASTVKAIYARVKEAPTGSDLRIDFNKNGNTSVFETTNYLTISATENAGSVTSDFSSTHAVLAAGDYLTVDIDQVGSTNAGNTLSVAILVG